MSVPVGFYCPACQMQVDDPSHFYRHRPEGHPDAPSFEEVQKVTPFGREDPVAFVCGNCGRKLDVVSVEREDTE